MAIWIYIAGVIAALVAFALIIYYEDKKLTVGTLIRAIVYSLISWGAVLAAICASLYYFIDWNKELWRKQNERNNRNTS